MGDVEELVAKARKGDRDAFASLVALTYTDTYTLAFRLTGSDADACDVVQDTYVRAFRSIAKFRGDARFSTWLFRITANCASTHMTRSRRNRHEPLDDDHVVVDIVAAHDPQHTVDIGVLHRRLVEALEALPKHMREVVVLRDVYDLTHDDIAIELDISVTAAKVRLHRARRKLREMMATADPATRHDISAVVGNADRAMEVEAAAYPMTGTGNDDPQSGGERHAM